MTDPHETLALTGDLGAVPVPPVVSTVTTSLIRYLREKYLLGLAISLIALLSFIAGVSTIQPIAIAQVKAGFAGTRAMIAEKYGEHP